MNELLAALICVFGGLTGGLVGVGGGILFVPALTVFIGLTQVEAEATSLLMIVVVALVGSYRQHGYGNVRLREALIVGALSPLGVLAGVALATSPNESSSSPSRRSPCSWHSSSCAEPGGRLERAMDVPPPDTQPKASAGGASIAPPGPIPWSTLRWWIH